jgi:two-component system NtrC family sensor kinase
MARRLAAGGPPEAALSGIAGLLREALAAERVTIWHASEGVPGFRGLSVPDDGSGPDFISDLALVPADGGVVPIGAGGPRPLGVLQVQGGSPGGDGLSRIAADLLAGYLGTVRLAEAHAGARAEQAQETDAERRFTELIIDLLPVGLYAVDRDYRIRVWNRNREMGTQGLRRAEVVGRTVFEVLTRQPREQLKEEFDRIFETGEVRQTEMAVEGPNGARTFRLTRIPMRAGGDTISHVITIGEDVTEWREVQAHILQSEKLAAVGQLAAGIMHEINNPLATIAACVAAGEGRLAEVSGTGEAALREYLAIIDREVQRCTSIVDGLLDFSRPKGKAKAPADVNLLVEQTLGLLRHHKRFRSIVLQRELAPALPEVVVNGEQIVQVLMALMINALDAMEGGGRLTVRTALSMRHGGEVIVEVEDTGPGIAVEARTKIFEPFFTTKALGRGTGLGLSISYGIVEEHRGRIEVDSQPGRGATFRVHLPTGGTT